MVESTVISTFAGGGGSSLGYKWAGFKELLAIDFDKNAVETLKANFDFPVWHRDITTVTAKEILDFCNIKKGELDILDGSPPCQGFSTAGKRQVSDPRNRLFESYVELIHGLQPKVFVMENVSGMIKGTMKGMFNEILSTLKSLNYNVKVKLMNAKYYEVPQSRERLIFIGVRKDLNKQPVFPIPSNKIITVKDILVNDVRPKAEYSHKRYGDIYININKPLNTVTKLNRYFLNSDNMLSLNELKLCCSFPEGYNLIGSYTDGKNRLGNAVMPKMMYHIAKTIKEQVLNA